MIKQRGWIVGTVWMAVVGMALARPADAQTFVQVSVATDGTPGNAASGGPVFSGDGKVVAFSSDATNLVPGDTNNSRDVFVRDLAAHTTTRVSVTSAGLEKLGTSGNLYSLQPNDMVGISLSGDGSIVAFSSRAPLVDNDTNGGCFFTWFDTTQVLGCSDIYVHNRSTGQTERISVASDGTQSDGDSVDPKISADGRYVVFASKATNLVANDRHDLADVFLHDRATHTTTRLSVSASGNDLGGFSDAPRISADGNIVVFLSDAAIVSDPDPLPCPSTGGCPRAYVLDRAAGTVRRINIPAAAWDVSPGQPNGQVGARVQSVEMSADGRIIAMGVGPCCAPGIVDPRAPLVVYDRLTGRLDWRQTSGTPNVTLSGNGRFVVIDGSSGNHTGAMRLDRLTNHAISIPLPYDDFFEPSYPIGGRFSPDGNAWIVTDTVALAGGDTNNLNDVYLLNRDGDGNGIPDDVQARYGLPPDPSFDSDGDHISNLQEYLNGTNPKGTFQSYFAEGAANSFFTASFAVFNPGDQTANVVLEFLGSNGQSRSIEFPLLAHTRATYTLDDTTAYQPDNDFSTIIDSDQLVVVDRTMTWDKTGYGSHAETAIEKPQIIWYMAEGSTGGSFDLFYLLQNPGDDAADVTITYLLPAPAAPVIKHYTIDPKSRKTIHVDEEDPALQFTDVSAKVNSTQLILVERAMYFSTPTQAFAAGHEGAAVPAPSKTWFLAEGATGSFFDLFLLLANAETTDADVTVTYLLPSGDPIVKHYDVKAQSRRTINVDFEDPRLIDTPVSTKVKSEVPVIAERAMWWPSPNWYEAHLSAGVTAPGTKWALAEGYVSNAAGKETETFILIANTSNTAGTAEVTLYYDGVAHTRTYPLQPNSRTNVRVQTDFPDALNKTFGTIITSNGVPIVVERAMYANANGQTWAAGTDALATKLQ
jgi:hypothetical protein